MDEIKKVLSINIVLVIIICILGLFLLLVLQLLINFLLAVYFFAD